MTILRYQDVKWSLPLLFSNDEYILAVSTVMKRLDLKNPITYPYGMVPSLWTGGRISSKRSQNKFTIERLLTKVLSTGSIPTFTMTRYDIEKDDLNDSFCNWLLDFGVEHGCQFIMTSDLLYDYIKNKHPEAKCVASVLKPIYELEKQELSEIDYYNNLLDKFDRVVLRPEYCLKPILDEYKNLKDISRVEVLINQICVPNCKCAIDEHLNIPKTDWAQFSNKELPPSTVCPRSELEKKNGIKINFTTPTLMFTEDEVNNLVYNLGVKDLKLQGRNYNITNTTRMINNFIFENIGEYQNVMPVIWGMCENIRERGLTVV